MASIFDTLDVYSLWLMAEGEDHDRFQRTINLFVDPSQPLWFEAHATIEALPEFKHPAAIISRLEGAQVFTGVGPIPAEVLGFGMRDSETQAFHFPIYPSRKLRELNSAVTAAMGMDPNPEYYPHISGAYGSFSYMQKREMLQRVSLEFPCSVRFTRATLHHAKGYPNQWQKVHEWTL